MSILRKVGMVFGGSTVFSASVYLSYQYQLMERKRLQSSSSISTEQSRSDCNEQRQERSYSVSCNQCSNDSFSRSTKSKRNEQYDKIADKFDDSVGWDEMILGMNLLRRSLLYFHARGTVLEVGAGTGRNIDYYPFSPINHNNDQAERTRDNKSMVQTSSVLSKNSHRGVDRVILTDVSEPMLHRAQEKIRKLTNPETKKRFAVLVADAQQGLRNIVPDNSIDTVVDTFGLCSYDDPIAALNEMARICKKKTKKGSPKNNPSKTNTKEDEGGTILLLEHGRSHSNRWITSYLDTYAEEHASNWGCEWNRDLDEILANSNVTIDVLYKFHFGTTYYVVCRPKEDKKETMSL